MVLDIRDRADKHRRSSDANLLNSANELSYYARQLDSVDVPQVRIPAMALAVEAIRRATTLQLHDEQIHGALTLSSGRIAQMQTGEGKTLVAIAGAFVQSLLRCGVHVSTTNSYLAERDGEQAASILKLLGVSVGNLIENSPVDAVRAAYACDVTYGTGYQFGFDYLRDQMTRRDRAERPLGSEVVAAIHGNRRANDCLRQRGFAMAIVDEADSVMIDEAMVPLVLSGQPVAEETDEAFRLAHDIAVSLEVDQDFMIDTDSAQIGLSTDTRERIHKAMHGMNLRQLVRPWNRYVENALYAIHNLHPDVHYVVQDDEVQLVDRNTGRIFPDRTWRDGLHQAVETKEGVTIRPNDFSTTRITRQRFFRFYDRVGGLTGTASEGAAELNHFYGLEVVDIPTHRPCVRKRLPARFFATTEAKYAAIVRSVCQFHARKQPVLVGTNTIQQSYQLSTLLGAVPLQHVILNGVQDETEAEIIGVAGHAGAVTVATNMAGRGTDIKPTQESISLGGLHVIATEHSTSTRIDRQLIGRSARQGDPGSCQHFVSAEDELLTKYAPGLARKITSAADSDGECRLDFSSEISRLQSQIEERQFVARKKVVQSDAWFDNIRKALH
jgi:preprotein translocase subunit SecA